MRDAMSDMQNDKVPVPMTEEQNRRLRQRNLALALVLGALVALFFIVTIAKLGGNVANRMI